jgi:hypothetical protein
MKGGLLFFQKTQTGGYENGSKESGESEKDG